MPSRKSRTNHFLGESYIFFYMFEKRQESTPANVGDVRLSFIVVSGFFQVTDRWAGEELSLFTANLNDKGSGREICIFLLDNYIYS